MANIIKRINFNPIGGASNAAGVSYDNTTSGLAADNVQDAVDEVVVLANDAQADATQAQTEVDALETVVTALDTRVGTAESDIDALQAVDVALDVRLDTAEADIDQLQIDVVAAQTDADAAQGSADAAQASIDAHIADTTGAHSASAISNTPAGTITSTDIQAAINELDGDVTAIDVRLDTAEADIDALQAADITIQVEVDQVETDLANHIASATAHAADDITYTNPDLAATNVQDAIDELVTLGATTTATLLNNQTSAVDVTGLSFAPSVNSFNVLVTVQVNATTSLFEVFNITGINLGSSWNIAYDSVSGASSDVAFSITNAGQIQYTSGNYAGFASGTIKYKTLPGTLVVSSPVSSVNGMTGDVIVAGGGGGTSDHTLLSNIGTNTHAQIDTHIASTSNPHSVTKAQVGLSNVPNTDTTNASNISSGTLDGDRLPAISTTKKGAVPATGTPSGLYLKDDGTWAAAGSSLSGLTDNRILRADSTNNVQNTGFTCDDNNVVDLQPGHIHSTIQTLTDGTNISWDLNTRQVAQVTLAGNRTLDNPTNMKSGGSYTLFVKQDATGSRTLAYGANYKWFGGVVPVLSTAANSVDIITLTSDGTYMYGSIQRGFV